MKYIFSKKHIFAIGLLIILPILFILSIFVYPKLPNRTEQYDHTADGINETFVVYRLWKQKYAYIDGNSDGNIDFWEYRDNSGNLEKIEIDNNFDGKPDFWALFNKSNIPIRIIRDDNYDGTYDTPIENEVLDDSPTAPYYERKQPYLMDNNYFYSKGLLTKEESRIDGVIYTISYYNNGKITKDEMYKNSGVLDTVTYYDNQEKGIRMEGFIDSKWESWEL